MGLLQVIQVINDHFRIETLWWLGDLAMLPGFLFSLVSSWWSTMSKYSMRNLRASRCFNSSRDNNSQSQWPPRKGQRNLPVAAPSSVYPTSAGLVFSEDLEAGTLPQGWWTFIGNSLTRPPWNERDKFESGRWFQPLWKILVIWDYDSYIYILYIWKNK